MVSKIENNNLTIYSLNGDGIIPFQNDNILKFYFSKYINQKDNSVEYQLTAYSIENNIDCTLFFFDFGKDDIFDQFSRQVKINSKSTINKLLYNCCSCKAEIVDVRLLINYIFIEIYTNEIFKDFKLYLEAKSLSQLSNEKSTSFYKYFNTKYELIAVHYSIISITNNITLKCLELYRYIEISNKYIELLHNSNIVLVIRENSYFIEDEEVEMKELIRYDICMQDRDCIALINNSFREIKNEIILRNKSITNFLIDRMDLENVYFFNYLHKNYIAFSIQILTNLFLHYSIGFIAIFGYLFGNEIIFNCAIIAYLIIGVSSIFVLPFFHLFALYIHKDSFSLFTSKKYSINFNEKPNFNYSIFLPKYLISICIGWFFLLPYSNDIFSVIDSVNQSIAIFSIIVFLVFTITASFIINELRIYKPFASTFFLLTRVLKFAFWGLPVSIFIGIILMTFAFNSHLENSINFTGGYREKELNYNLKSVYSKYDSVLDKTNYPSFNNSDSIVLVNEINKLYSIIDIDCKGNSHIEKKNDDYYLKDDYRYQIESHLDSYFKQRDNEVVSMLIKYEQNLWKNKGNSITFCHIKILCFDLFFFPRLLLLAAITSYLLGFFAQYILDSRSTKG